MSVRMSLVAACLIAAACGSKSGGGAGTGPEPPIDAAAAATPADAGPAGLTEAECEELLDHLIAVERQVQAGEVDPDLQPTDDQVEVIRDEMRAQFMEPCLASTRELYDCAMQAQTREAFAACGTSE